MFWMKISRKFNGFSVFILFVLSPLLIPSGHNIFASETTVPLEKLIQRLKHPHSAHCWNAICALGASGYKQAVPPLMEALELDMKEHTGIAMAIIPALGELGDKRAVPLLLKALNITDEEWLGREAAARALGRIGSSMAVSGLIRASWLPETRHAAIEALARIKDPRAIPSLLSALGRSEDPVARQAAVEALVDIGKPAVPGLIETLESPYPEDHARALAAGILGKIGDSRAVGPLQKARDDPNEVVQKYAEKAIELMSN